MVGALAYVGDALSIIALSITFSLALAIARVDPDENPLLVWGLPAVSALVAFPLGYLARVWPQEPVEAGLVLGARALISSLFAIAYLSLSQRR